jgi:hypothetical protein
MTRCEHTIRQIAGVSAEAFDVFHASGCIVAIGFLRSSAVTDSAGF